MLLRVGLAGSLLLATVSLLAARERKMAYPPTKKQDVVDTYHGTEIHDPYRWLENANDPEVKEWVAQQNAFTRSVLDKLPGREQIRERLTTLLNIGQIGTPAPVKG